MVPAENCSAHSDPDPRFTTEAGSHLQAIPPTGDTLAVGHSSDVTVVDQVPAKGRDFRSSCFCLFLL